jgi:ribonucleoside-diphosphate reductase beta chain
MEGNAKIIKFIQRDEALHFGITQNLLKIFRDEDREGFTTIAKKSEDKIYAVYEQAVKNEIEWAQYLFSKGSLLGLNADVLGGYSKWLCDNRLRSLGYKKLFNQKENPIAGWLDSYLDSSKVQVAPQETEISAYKIGARDTNIDKEEFSDIKL